MQKNNHTLYTKKAAYSFIYNVETGYLKAGIKHLSNIDYKITTKIWVDSQKHRIIYNELAMKLCYVSMNMNK